MSAGGECREFERFLDCLGERVQLRGWDRFRAGLDTKSTLLYCFSFSFRSSITELLLLSLLFNHNANHNGYTVIITVRVLKCNLKQYIFCIFLLHYTR